MESTQSLPHHPLCEDGLSEWRSLGGEIFWDQVCVDDSRAALLRG
eukprot:SAG11_NODE_33943_length_274_cov_1.188571_1_plen_44_part_01